MGSRGHRVAFYLAFASAASILFSIAASQILLALSLPVLLLSGEKLSFPPIRLPLLIFFTVTVAAVIFSVDPHGGTPQIRKFFVFGILLVICSTFKTVRQVQALVLVWAGIGSLSAMWGMVQLVQRHREALEQNADNYGFYLDGRITGLASHWMTFGGEQMIVVLMLASFLFFSRQQKWRHYAWPVLILLWVSITLGMTRSIFLLGAPLGMIYLLWRRRPLFVIIPVLATMGATVVSSTLRERILSVVKPHEDLDSNQRRTISRMAGWEMIKAHPWLGIGPEQIGKQFASYVPASVPRPLPKGWYGHLHNIYLQYAAERGIPGLLAILWLIGKVLFDFLRYLKRGIVAPEARFVLLGAIAVIVAVLAEGFFEYNLGDSEVLTMFLTVVACGYTVSKPRFEGVALAQSSAEGQAAEVLCTSRSTSI